MGLGYGFAFKNRRYESGCKAITCAYGIGYLNFRCRLERYIAGGEYIAAVDATGENQHLEIVFSKKDPAFVLEVDSGIAEHAAHGNQFLVVDQIGRASCMERV